MGRLLCIGLLISGCAAGAPAKTPESSAPVETAASAEPSPAEPAQASPADDKPHAGQAGVSVEDAQAVLQLVLDDDALGPYLHLDRRERFPLRVAARDLPAGIELTKATKPVVLVPDAEIDKRPIIVFSELRIEGDEASVRYRYDVEKVRGSASLQRRDGHWVLIRSRLSEH